LLKALKRIGGVTVNQCQIGPRCLGREYRFLAGR
jgi:hypothetical protein